MTEEVTKGNTTIVVKKNDKSIYFMRGEKVNFHPFFSIDDMEENDVYGSVNISDTNGEFYTFHFEGYEFGLALEGLLTSTSIPLFVEVYFKQPPVINKLFMQNEITSNGKIDEMNLYEFCNQRIGKDGDFFLQLEEIATSIWCLNMIFFNKIRATSSPEMFENVFN